MTVSDDDINELLNSELNQRRTRVMFLRNGGVTWAKIAEECGISETTARKDYNIVCGEINSEDKRTARARHRAVIYDIQRVMYPRLLGANFEDAVDAAKVILLAQRREANLLGLDQPVKIGLDVGTTEDFAIEAARLITSIQSLDADTLKELTRGHTQHPTIDAEVVDGDDERLVRATPPFAGQPAAVDPGGSGAEAHADARPSDVREGSTTAHDLPDDDDDWSNLGD